MFNEEMLAKLPFLKQEADDSKRRLEEIEISEEAGGGLIRVVMNGNRTIKALEINGDLHSMEKTDLEDLLVVALSRAMDRVNALNESEVLSSARSIFLGMR